MAIVAILGLASMAVDKHQGQSQGRLKKAFRRLFAALLSYDVKV